MLTYDYLGAGADKRFVDEKVMVQIAQRWRRPARGAFDDLFKDAAVWHEDNDDFRLHSFFVFWDTVKDRFSEDWTKPNSNLWKKVALWVLQDFVRQHMANQVELWRESNAHPMVDLDSLAKFVSFVLKRFPTDFFEHPWNHIDDTPNGRTELMQHMFRHYKEDKVDRRGALFKGA